ncbi:MAG: OsmC family protein [Terriglobales bacterium]
MLREAHAIWKDGPYVGEGALSTPSGVLNNAKYTFGSLTGLMAATSPGEMLAAAVSSSTARMLAMEMAKVGIKPIQVETDTALVIDFVGEALRIIGAHLKIVARTSDSESGRFEEAVEAARRECPITSILNIDMKCEAKLISAAVPVFV